MAQYDIVKGVKSSGLTLYENDNMFVYKGGSAISTSVKTGHLNIFSGGKTFTTWVDSNGLVTVLSGGIASQTNLSSTFASMHLSGGTANLTVIQSNGRLDVLTGGVANLTYVLGGSLIISNGGKAVNTELDRGGIATVLSGGSMINTRISSYKDTTGAYKDSSGKLHVSSGGSVTSVTVFSGGSLIVSNSGEANKAMVSSGGSAIVLAGGKANSTMVSSVGRLIVSNGGSAVGTTVSDGGRMVVSIGGVAGNTTVSSGGSMVLSSGGTATKATAKKGNVIVYSTASMTDLKLSGGSLYIQSGAIVNSITNKGAELTIEKGAVVDNYKGNPVKFPDCDGGWNNYLSSGTGPEAINTNVTNKTAVKMAPATAKIQMDTNNVSYNGLSNYVGYGDEADFEKISLNYAATLSFIVSATGATKFTIWSLTSGTKVKSLQATSLKKNAKTGEYYVETKGLLLEADTYYISVQSTDAKKGGNAYYSVAMNSESVFYSKGKSFDNDWNAFVKDNYTGEGYLGIVDGKKEKLVANEWVGYTDPIDFRKFKLASAAKLSFAVRSTDAMKVSICRVDSRGQEESVIYSLVVLQNTTLKELGKNDYFAVTKLILLDPGYYYIRVESTNAKKGGYADYSVSLDMGESVFFTKGKSFDNDWNAFVKDNYTGEGYLGIVDGKKEKLVANEWVGYTDPIDFRKFKLASAAKLSFAVRSTDAMKVSLCRVDSRGQEESVTYSLVVLQNTTLKELGKNDYFAVTNLILLDPGYYYIRVESTNAKKGGYADYSVSLDTGESVFFTRGNTADDWTDKDKGWIANKKYEYTVKTAGTLISDEWVGYNDEIDYRKITLTTEAKLSFGVFASDSVKFTIYMLNQKEKNGEVTYYLTKLQTTTIKAGEWRPTNPIKLNADSYYFSVESTNAKKGGNASYDVEIINFSPTNAGALTGPEEDANDWSGAAGAADSAAFADTLAEPGLAAFSGTDPGEQMSGAGDPTMLQIPADASDGIFAGLQNAADVFSDAVSPDGLRQDDTLPGLKGAVLA